MWLASMGGATAGGHGTVPQVTAAALTHVKVWYTPAHIQIRVGNSMPSLLQALHLVFRGWGARRGRGPPS
jgi:hypothetical protein